METEGREGSETELVTKKKGKQKSLTGIGASLINTAGIKRRATTSAKAQNSGYPKRLTLCE